MVYNSKKSIQTKSIGLHKYCVRKSAHLARALPRARVWACPRVSWTYSKHWSYFRQLLFLMPPSNQWLGKRRSLNH